MSDYPRESIELVPVTVQIDGAPVTEGFTLALTAGRDRPSAWVAPTVIGASVGWLLDGTLAPGTYSLWAKVVAAPETPVIDLGRIAIT